MPDPVIEIVSYTPVNMADFLRFVVEGKPDGHGDFETDDQGRRITGVLRWLHGREVPEAHFFHSEPGENVRGVRLFAATILRLENYNVPWLRRIPGFMDIVTDDGMLGTTNAFAPLSDLMAVVRTDPTLDDRYAQGRHDLERLFAEMQEPGNGLSVGRRGLLATLRGDIGTDPLELFAEVRNRFKISL